ncbi:hypothetical protein [Actinoalloteichus sp. GBA129-24]|uniref:hypothetical protein n=1 Tax=Actinoalloteichus sp. GBA129-24 TaxID=1612551 RepID=UPI0009535067|nr:hypothetical protein [Actinoalloteichus sp. GBA129-24]
MDIDTVGEQLLAQQITTTYVGGPVDGATREIPLDEALALAAAQAVDDVNRHPETRERVRPSAPYRMVIDAARQDEGVSLDPEEHRPPRALWVYAGPLETIL